MKDQKLSNHLVSILGLTATGKTSLGLWLAEKLIADKKVAGVFLISADSRQVYQGLETISGADIPSNFICKQTKNYRYFTHQTLPIQLHGASIIPPDKEWSVAHFRDFAISRIKQAWEKNFLPIIVGGAGFYHLQLFNNDPDPYIEPNIKIREKAEKLNVEKLKDWLKKESLDKFEKMNQSDQNNPRRLIRGIEVATASKNLNNKIKNRPRFKVPQHYSVLRLNLSLKDLEKNIKKRVVARFTQGAIQEVENLLALKLDDDSPAMTTAGVHELTKQINKKTNSKDIIQAWTQTELQYAKRQITWWKKRKKIDWFDSTEADFKLHVYQKITAELKL